MTTDPKATVVAGYDRIGDVYLEAFGRSAVRSRKLGELVRDLRPGASILDLGCGAGVPVLRELADRGYRVMGVDASSAQIERARTHVPDAALVCSDMTDVTFPPGTFDAVGAFHALSHVPRGEHAGLLRRIAAWLRPAGRFVASFGTREGDWSGEWLGVPMFFSHHDPKTAERLVAEAGLALECVETLKQDNEPVEFLWITACKR